jgi:hypothetical protein
MKHISESEIAKFYDYAMRDGFLYARSFRGSGYGEFLKDLEQKLLNGELTLEQAFDQVNNFKPSHAIEEIKR